MACRIHSPEKSVEIQIPNFTLHGDLDLHRDLLRGNLQYQLGDPETKGTSKSKIKTSSILFENKMPEFAKGSGKRSAEPVRTSIKFSTGLRSSAELGFSFAPRNSLWTLEIKPSQFLILADRLHFLQQGISQLNRVGQVEKNELQIDQQQLSCKASMDGDIRFRCVDQIDGLLKNDFNSKKLNLQLSLDGSLDQKLENLQSKFELALEPNALVFGVLAKLKTGPRVEFSGKGDLYLNSKLSGVIGKLAALEKFGDVGLDFDLKSQLGQSANKKSISLQGAVNVASERLGSWTTQVQSEVVQILEHASQKNSHLSVATHLTLNESKGQGLVRLGSTKFTNQLAQQNVRHTRSDLPFRLLSPVDMLVDFDKNGDALVVKAQVQTEKLLAYTETKSVKTENTLRDLQGRAETHLDMNSKNFSIEQLQFTSREPSLALNVEGTGNLLRKDLNSRVGLSVSSLESLRALSAFHDQHFKGSVEVPFNLTVVGGTEVNVSGQIKSQEVSWRKNDFAASGVSGAIAFDEKIRFDGKNFHFSNLISQNPFERADFEKIRPLLAGTEPFKISQINWYEKSYGPFVGVVSLQQNMFMAKQFDLDLLSGRVFGQLFTDLNTKNLQIGVLARWTAVDLEEILPERFLKKMKAKQHEILSGRTGFVVNLNRASADGRFDLTQVGSRQLLTLLASLDPNYEDEKFNKLRTALQVGFPTSLMLNFADGFLNLDVTLSVLGLANRQVISGIPISSFVQKVTSEILQNLEKVPLQ